MSIRTWLTLPSLGLLAAACGNDGSATTSDETTSTGGQEGSSSTDDPTVAPETTAPADTSTTDPGTETTAPDPDTSSGSTGEPVLCGNGDLDDGEECDDENVVDGDTCTATCTIPYEVVWQDSHNGSQSNQDTVSDMVVDADGNIYVVGSERVTGEGSNLWLRQYMADGTAGWTVSYNGLLGGDDSGAALALLPDGDIVVVGTVESEFSGDDILVARIDGTTQAIEWEAYHDGPEVPDAGDNIDADSGADVFVDADGNIYVAGTERFGPSNWDFWVGKYDGDGVEVWSRSYAGAAEGADFARAVVVDADGVTWLLGNEEDAGGDAVATVLGYDVDGEPLAADTQVFDFRGRDMTIDADGNIVVLGDASLGATFFDLVVRKYDPTWAELWAVDIDHDGSDDLAVRLSVGPTGNVMVGGTTRVSAAAYDAYLALLDSDGARLWAAVYGNAEAVELDDQFSAAIEHTDGDIVAAGFESVLGEQRNGLVIKYHAL
jgi:uncharacterized delta-60 repeat protein